MKQRIQSQTRALRWVCVVGVAALAFVIGGCRLLDKSIVVQPSSAPLQSDVKPDSEGSVEPNNDTTSTKPTDKKSCEALGGKWLMGGMESIEECYFSTSDAGKECSDSSECEGSCEAELFPEIWDRIEKGPIYTKGRCSGTKNSGGGCSAYVEDGKIEGIICLD